MKRFGAAVRGLPAGLRLLGRGLALVTAGAPAGTAVFLGLVVVLSLLPVGQVWLGKGVVDRLAVAPSAARVAPTALALALLWVLVPVVVAALEPVRELQQTRLRDAAVAALDRRLMAAGERLADLTRVDRPAFSDDLRLVEEVVAQAPSLLRFLQNGLGAALTLGGLLLLLGRLHPLLPLALAVLTLPHAAVVQRTSLLRYRALLRRSRAAREMDYCLQVATEPAAAKEVRVFGLGDFFLRRYENRFAAALRETTPLRVRELLLAGGFAGLHALVLAGGFWYVAAAAAAGRASLGEVALYLGAVTQAEARLLTLSTAFGTAHQVVLQLPRFFAFLDGARPGVAHLPPGAGLPAPAALRAGVVLQGVGFRYPEQPADAPPVLDGVTATLPAGTVTALVGANGAGKSTIVKLLTRMYDPMAGEVLLDGQPLAAYDLAGLRRRIAVVYQDFARFALTLRENVAVGLPEVAGGEAAATDSGPARSVESAADLAGTAGVAARLPSGYETPLTRRFAGGVDLSGGEWQTVALARAFVRDAALVILDEPTAALDAAAEARLFERLRELVQGKTALLISHRFSTVRMADQILILEDGRIVEAGSHAELVAAGGRYAELYALQAQAYRVS